MSDLVGKPNCCFSKAMAKLSMEVQSWSTESDLGLLSAQFGPLHLRILKKLHTKHWFDPT